MWMKEEDAGEMVYKMKIARRGQCRVGRGKCGN
jgi:hypothetical protein